jgi:hypothetical protein
MFHGIIGLPYHKQLDKLLFEELTVDSGKWKVNVSTAWIYLKYIAEGDTTTVHCQLSTAKFQIPIYLPINDTALCR